MFADNLARAIEAAPTNQLDHLARLVWQGHGSGVLDDNTAQAAAERIYARKAADRPQAPAGFRTVSVAFPAPRRQRSPDRQRSLERRRRLAASGPLPPALAVQFTVAELAVLRIVGDEVRVHGCCSLHLDAIAARAGVCRTSAQNALREARRLGLVTVHERRRRGQPSATNIVRVISAEWLAWLRLSPKGGGFKILSTTVTRNSRRITTRTTRTDDDACRYAPSAHPSLKIEDPPRLENLSGSH
jgi:hypothetical protein